MNACTRIFLSLSIVGLAVLAGPLPTADARGGHGGGHGGHGGKGHPKPAAHAHTPAHRNPGHAVGRRPGRNARIGFRIGWGGRPFANAWLGRGVYGWRTYGGTWYTPGTGSWYYPGYVFRTVYYPTNPTTDLYLTSPGFSGGFDMMLPTVPATDSQQPMALPIQK